MSLVNQKCKWLLGPLISLLSVLVFFGCFELTLALIGFGHSSQFFTYEKDQDGIVFVRENSSFAHPYFPPSIMRRPQSFRLLKDKQDNEFRIFILGSSAAMGDPEASFSISRILNCMLDAACLNKEIEVVNAAMTAINSHVVRRIARDCAKLEPDLFVVYEGNNEVIGPYGPSEAFSGYFGAGWFLDTLIAFRETRIGQLINTLMHLGSSNHDLANKWGGMEHFLSQKISSNDVRLETVYHSFEKNLKHIIKTAQHAECHALLCTVLTNQKDFSPFHSLHRSDLSDAELERWESYVAAGDRSMAAGDNSNALNQYLAAERIDADYAELTFRIGRLYLSNGQHAEANQYLQRALDLDALRFRADSYMNNIIRGLNSYRDAQLIDLEKIFQNAGDHVNSLGNEWLYEHVHLNFYANYQIALLLFQHIMNQLSLMNADEQEHIRILSYSDVKRVLAYTPYEQGMIASELLNRFSKPPFTSQMDASVRIDDWKNRVSIISEKISKDETQQDVLKMYQASLENRYNWVVERNYGMALLSFGHYQFAIEHLEKVLLAIGEDADVLFSLGVANLAINENRKAFEFFRSLKEIAPQYPELDHYWKQLTEKGSQ